MGQKTFYLNVILEMFEIMTRTHQEAYSGCMDF